MTHVRAGKFAAVTADMLDHDYAGGANAAGAPKLVVNTSCEHLEAFDRWYARIPDGQLLALQSNDYFACSEHVNCVPDLAAFRRRHRCATCSSPASTSSAATCASC